MLKKLKNSSMSPTNFACMDLLFKYKPINQLINKLSLMTEKRFSMFFYASSLMIRNTDTTSTHLFSHINILFQNIDHFRQQSQQS